MLAVFRIAWMASFVELSRLPDSLPLENTSAVIALT